MSDHDHKKDVLEITEKNKEIMDRLNFDSMSDEEAATLSLDMCRKFNHRYLESNIKTGFHLISNISLMDAMSIVLTSHALKPFDFMK